MKKPLHIQILQFVSKLPPERFPIQDLSTLSVKASEAEVLQSIQMLADDGGIKAAIVNDHMGRPAQAAIRSITLEGRKHLDGWLDEARKKDPIHKATKLGRDAGVFGFGAITGGVLTKFGEYLFDLVRQSLHLH
jgi:hypothetical protein